MPITPAKLELISELIDASQEIGGIHESAQWFTDLLADKIEATGQCVGDLTVTELRALNRELRDRAKRAANHANRVLGSTKY
jgi:hypothetical protein